MSNKKSKIPDKKSFLLYCDQSDLIEKLSDAQAGSLIKQIYSYCGNGRERPEINDPLVDIVFTALQTSLDRDHSKYLKIVERNRNNGRLGGRAKQPKEPSGLSGNPKNPSEPDSGSGSDSGSDKKTPGKTPGTNFQRNNNVKNQDFTENLSDTFIKINSDCNAISKLPKDSKRKEVFNSRKWAQKQINLKKHPGAVSRSLDGLKLYWDRSRDPWSYLDTILSKVNGNFNESESIKIHDHLKSMNGNPDLMTLTSGLFKSLEL